MEILLNSNIDLPDDLFRLIRDLIYQRSGIFFSDNSKYLLQKRLSGRARELNFDSFRQYYYYLMYDPGADQEFDRIYDLITTNETYFFREGAQLKAFIEEIIPEIIAAKAGAGSRAKIRLWSAGCSSGEEPYTLAMLMLEHDVYRQAEIDIFASDINQQVIFKARKGVYRENSFRQTDPYYLTKYFTEEAPGQFKIQDKVKNLVSFGRLNLHDPTRVSLLGFLDIIFCRNVIIYFDEASKRKVIDTFYERLLPGSYLLLGHSESLISLSTSFKLRHLKNDMVYQK